jgi:hypothetical protein
MGALKPVSKEPQRSITTVFNMEDTIANLNGDHELLKEVVEKCVELFPESIAAIRNAIDERNACDLAKSAHKLRGMVCYFNAHSVMESARKLELMGKNSDLALVEDVFVALEKELGCLKRALEQFAWEFNSKKVWLKAECSVIQQPS